MQVAFPGNRMSRSRAIDDATSIFSAALERVDPRRMVERAVELDGDRLGFRTGTESLALDLGDFDRIVAFGAGKASAPMALALEGLLAGRLSGGIVVVKTGHVEDLSRITLLEAAHPVPDESSVAAAQALLGLGREADARTLFIGLTSGGGSALLCAPLPGLGLADKQAATRLLLECGAPIREINCVRKHLSAIKNGGLARALAPGTVVNLILSDVIGDDPCAIASGITAPDATRPADALEVLARHGLLDRVPAAVRRTLERDGTSRDPGGRVHNLVIGSNHQALLAARAKAEELGYAPLVLTSRLEGEAREAGRFLMTIAEDLRDRGLSLPPPACVLCGGETTVTLRGDGLGGRNQELALAALAHFEEEPGRMAGLTLLSAGTDGNDGPTDAAGAFACPGLLSRARSAGLSARAFLARNDSYRFFERLDGHLRTGPTNTNVCDLQVLIVERP